MRRELPEKPNLEHLKSQAKDLVDAHRRGDPAAIARIRAAVPAFANKSDEDIARGPFALHDAQSAIAREYGFVSWAELRTKVAGASGADPAPADPTSNEAMLARLAAQNLPPDIEAAFREALTLRGTQTDAPTPSSVPVLPLRNHVVVPGAMLPIDISRPSTLRAIEAAMQSEPRFLAVFAQRAFDTERPLHEDLHPTGCLCIARVLHRFNAETPPVRPAPQPDRPLPTAMLIIEGIRSVTLESLDQIDPYHLGRVADSSLDRGDDQQIAALDRQLRELAHRFADTMPIRDQVNALIDRTTEARQLADIVMANFPMPVAEMAAYAEETQLSRKLDRAIAVLGAELAKVQAAPA